MNMMEEMPKLSVVIPVYNGAKFISDALDSIFGQDYENIEVIVVDDRSTDNTIEVLQSYPQAIKIIRNKNNSGASHSRNQGIKHAVGEYIAFLDADDVWLKNKLTRQVKAMIANPEAGLIYGGATLVNFGEDSSKLLSQESENTKLEKKSTLDIFRNPYFSTSTILVKKSLCEDVGYFREDLKTAEDVDFVLKLSNLCEFLAMNAPLSLTRRVENSLGSADSSYQDNLDVVSFFLKNNPDFTIKNRKVANKVQRKIYDDWLENLVFKRKISQALNVGLSSITKVPLSTRTIKLICKALVLRLRYK